jgi:hypothetical protein
LSRVRLSVELLEDRLALSTLFVGPNNYATLQEALAHANNGDSIEINPGVSISSGGSTLGQSTAATILYQGSSPGDSTLVVNELLSPNEEIQIGTGATAETNLVLNAITVFTVAPGPVRPVDNLFNELILKQPLTFAHNPGERIDTIGKIGIGKAVTITGLGGPSGTPVNSGLDVWGETTGVTLENLNFASPVGLLTGSQSTTISNCTLKSCFTTSQRCVA